MSQIVTCICGQRFRAAAHLAGTRVACPACGSQIGIPKAEPVIVTCACGQRFRAQPHLIGNTVRCPACSGPLRVAETNSVTGFPTRIADPMGLGSPHFPASDSMHLPSFRRHIPATRPPIRIQLNKTAIGVVVAILVVIFMVAGGLTVARRLTKPGREVNEELARVRELGEPITPDELETYYRLPPGATDSTQAWIRAIQSVNLPAQSPRQGGTAMDSDGLPWMDFTQTQTQPLLDNNRVALQSLHEAARQGGNARYPTSFHSGHAMDMPVVCKLGDDAGRLLRIEASSYQFKAPGRSVESIRTLLMAAQSLNRHPTLAAQLVRQKCLLRAIDSLLEILPCRQITPADLQELRDLVRAYDMDSSLYDALLGERVMSILTFQGKTPLPDVKTYEMKQVKGSMVDFSFYLQVMRGYLSAAKQPWPARRTAALEVKKSMEATLNTGPLAAFCYPLSAEILEALYYAFEANAVGTVAKDGADLAIAAELHRRDTSLLPDSPQNLVPRYLERVPSDPFTGEPLKYRVTEKEYSVYSIGADGVDNSGEGTLSGGPDIVLHVILPLH